MSSNTFHWIAFDADDTLWQNEALYREGRDRFLEIVSRYNPQEGIEEYFHETEIRNIPYYGYGVMSFVLSMIDAAVDLTEERIQAEDIQALIDLSKEMLTSEVTLFEGVPDLISSLSAAYPLMLITKGDLFHQQRKVEESGLGPYFKSVEVVSEKTADVYQEILDRHEVDVDRFVMVGNSIRSDIQPILELGGWAIHVTPHLSWDYEGGEIEGALRQRFREVERLEELPQTIHSMQRRNLS